MLKLGLYDIPDWNGNQAAYDHAVDIMRNGTAHASMDTERQHSAFTDGPNRILFPFGNFDGWKTFHKHLTFGKNYSAVSRIDGGLFLSGSSRSA
jgi:hypothetical protein